MPWVPPFGAAPVTPAPAIHARGLRQCEQPLRLSRWGQRGAQDDPDAGMELPAPGRYEFFSPRAATAAPVLLALDRDQGLPFVRLPHSQRWEALVHAQGRLLAPSGLRRGAWRCGLAESAKGSRLLLPTRSGLARLRPDAPALRFELDCLGEAPALGAPIQLGSRVWLPLQRSDGAVRFLGLDAQGAPVFVDLDAVAGQALGPLQAPVSTLQWAAGRA